MVHGMESSQGGQSIATPGLDDASQSAVEQSADSAKPERNRGRRLRSGEWYQVMAGSLHRASSSVVVPFTYRDPGRLSTSIGAGGYEWTFLDMARLRPLELGPSQSYFRNRCGIPRNDSTLEIRRLRPHGDAPPRPPAEGLLLQRAGAGAGAPDSAGADGQADAAPRPEGARGRDPRHQGRISHRAAGAVDLAARGDRGDRGAAGDDGLS